jgi:hypothetical protein
VPRRRLLERHHDRRGPAHREEEREGGVAAGERECSKEGGGHQARSIEESSHTVINAVPPLRAGPTTGRVAWACEQKVLEVEYQFGEDSAGGGRRRVHQLNLVKWHAGAGVIREGGDVDYEIGVWLMRAVVLFLIVRYSIVLLRARARPADWRPSRLHTWPLPGTRSGDLLASLVGGAVGDRDAGAVAPALVGP